jgi:hypothetical protein
VATLVIFGILASQTLDKRGATLSIILMSLSDFHIYYSAELKQYATELLITMILYIRFWDPKIFDNKSQIFFLLIYGLIAIFFAHTAILILAPLALLQFYVAGRKKDEVALKKLFLIGFIWLEALLIVHGRTLQVMLGNAVIVKGANKFFVPYPIFSERALVWIGEAFGQIFQDLLGLAYPFLGMALCGIGLVVLSRRNPRQGILLTAPLLLAFLGAVLHKYPFAHRFLIFSLPALILFLVQGGLAIVDRITSRPIRLLVGGSLCVLLLLKPIQQARYFLIHDRETPQNRQAVQYLKAHRQPGDALILNHSAQFGYGFYLGYDGFENAPSMIRKVSDTVFHDGQRAYCFIQDVVYQFQEAGNISGVKYQGERSKVYVKGENHPWGYHSRTWVLLVHESQDLQRFVLENLRDAGVLLDEKQYLGASVYLFDMSLMSGQKHMTLESTESAAAP